MNKTVAFVASVDFHLISFHIPYMNWWKSMGYSVDCICGDTGRGSELTGRGYGLKNVSFSRAPFSMANIKAYLELKKLFREGNYSLIHCHTPSAAFLARMANRSVRSGSSIIYTAHGFHFHPRGGRMSNAVFLALEKMAASWTDVLITINKDDFAIAKKHLVKAGRIEYVPGVGVDVSEEMKLSSSKENRPPYLMLGSVCELNENKGLEEQLHVIALLRAKGLDARLEIAGEGTHKGRLLATASALGISNFVSLLGYRQDIPALLDSWDIFLFTSRREGLPRSVMEAMSHALPVVAYSIRGVRDLVEDGVTGRLFRWGERERMAEAIFQLYTEREQLRAMGLAGWEKVRDGFSFKVVMPRMLEIYSHAVGIEGVDQY